MKSTLNSISTEGVKLVSSNIGTCGFFARSVEVLQLLADILAFRPEHPLSQGPLQNTRVALVKTPFWDMAGPGIIKAMYKAAEILTSHGVVVEAVELPAKLNDPQILVGRFSSRTGCGDAHSLVHPYKHGSSSPVPM